MTDTPADVQARFEELMLRRPGSDRVRMMSDMFDLARALIISEVRTRDPDIADVELHVQLFERLYGSDFDSVTRERVIHRIRGR